MGGCKDGKENCRERHLCKLVKREDLEKIRQLVKDAAYLCRKCGRAAHDRDHLCDPTPL